MKNTAKVFTNGGSQAIRLPKSYRFDEDEVLVHRLGNLVILAPTQDPWASLISSANLFTDDFIESINDDLPAQEREVLL